MNCFRDISKIVILLTIGFRLKLGGRNLRIKVDLLRLIDYL